MKKDSMKAVLVLMLMVCLVGSLFAAGAKESAPAKEVVTLEWWTWDSEEYNEASQR
ncbi:MAG: hypothetical protein GX836_03520, partial [Spirochaetales bacterium]|nr:hypothetical protein [Spirochaetales bacterium]